MHPAPPYIYTLSLHDALPIFDAIGDLTHVLEDLFEKMAEGQLEASDNMTDLLFACHDRLAQMVEQSATQKPCLPATELIEQVKSILRGESPAPLPLVKDDAEPSVSETTALAPEANDNDLISIFLDEGMDIHSAISECLAQWREEPEELIGVTQLQHELHTLKGGARLSDVDAIADLAEAWSDALDPLIAGSNNQLEMLKLSERALTSLETMLAQLDDGGKLKADKKLIKALKAAHEAIAPEDALEASAETMEPATDDVDPEVLEIFLEEAHEVMGQLEKLLGDWRKEPTNHSFNQEAQRLLHTLKGGARLSQLPHLGDRAHAFETLLIDLGGNAPNKSQWQATTEHYAAIIAMVAD